MRCSAVRRSRPMKSEDNKIRVLPVPAVVLVSAWFLFIVCAFSDAGTDLLAVLVLVYEGSFWGIVWLIRMIVSFVRQRRGSIPRQPLFKALLYWGFEPCALLLSAVFAFTDVLSDMRFHLSHHALDSYAAEVVAGRALPHGRRTPMRWVGLFGVRETELLPDGVVRIITSPDAFDDTGFARSPVSPPPRVGKDSYRPITDSWYYWHRSW